MLEPFQTPNLRPQAVKIVRRLFLQRASEQATYRRKARLKVLPDHYDNIKESTDASLRPTLPLFADFLLLPSVKALWLPDVEIDDAGWQASFEATAEELDDYRLELCLHARKLILQATLDEEAAGAAEEIDDGEAVDDDFFERATWILCCSFKYCSKSWTAQWNAHPSSLQQTSDLTCRPVISCVGSLAEILRHLHAHDDRGLLRVSVKASRLAEPAIHLSLPLEVACGVLSPLELHHLDEQDAQKHHLEAADKKVSGDHWVNGKSGKRKLTGGRAWHELLVQIRGEGDQAAKVGLFIDPPRIEFLDKRDKARAALVVDDSESDETDEGEEEPELRRERGEGGDAGSDGDEVTDGENYHRDISVAGGGDSHEQGAASSDAASESSG
ncbi:hypothetical protein JCM8202_002218 [Rhodotorula sphaerocarpa]